MRVVILALSVVALAAFLLLRGFGRETDVAELRVAEQYGLAYAPLAIIKHEGLLEKALPDFEVTWTRLTNAASIREAMVADRLDVGFMGVPPFLVGVDRDMDWQVFTALSEVPVGLVTLSEELSTLSDLAEARGRIALPQPGSIQHILLSMASETRFGRPDRFDDHLVTLSHPDAAGALIHGAGVDAHFATPPYLMVLTQLHGGRIVLSGTEAFGGPFTFAVGVAEADYLSRNPEVVSAFESALSEARARLLTQDAVEVLAGIYGIGVEETRQQLEQEGMRFGEPLRGIEAFSRFMANNGYLSEDLSTSRRLVYDAAEEDAE